MENQKKCSSRKHKDINAIFYCQECNIFMCNKFINLHDALLDFHHRYNLNEQNINEIFTGICKEPKHKKELDYFCKNHNQLCCVACLCKIKCEGKGQHNDCNVCVIKEIENEKKNKLKENIKCLEDLSNTLEQKINELKKLFEKINEKWKKMFIKRAFRNKCNNFLPKM